MDPYGIYWVDHFGAEIDSQTTSEAPDGFKGRGPKQVDPTPSAHIRAEKIIVNALLGDWSG